MMRTMTITNEHPASSYGDPVLLDDNGYPHKAGDLGLFSLPPNFCGRVDAGGKVYWSGYGDSPDKMWRALRMAHADNPNLRIVDVYDAGKIVLR